MYVYITAIKKDPAVKNQKISAVKQMITFPIFDQ